MNITDVNQNRKLIDYSALFDLYILSETTFMDERIIIKHLSEWLNVAIK